MSNGHESRRVSFQEVDDVLLVQCYDYETGETYFYTWDGEEYERRDSYTAEDGTTYYPNQVERTPREGDPLVRMAEKPVDYGDFGDLVQDIRDFIHSYGDVDEVDERFCAYYVIFTWVYDKSTVCPYLRFIGDAGKGKTRMLKTVGELCFFSKLTGASTKSAAIRSHSKWLGTSLFNEADGITGDETDDFTRWVNNGFEKGNPIEMSMKEQPDQQVQFDTYGPKIFASKNAFEDPATESRIISIEMEETDRDDIPILLSSEFYEEARNLRDKLLHFRMQNYREFDPVGEPTEIRELDIESRIMQISIPLYPVIAKHGEDAVNTFLDYLVERQEEVTKQRARSEEGIVFNKLYDIATGEFPGKFKRWKPEGELVGVTASMIAGELGRNWSSEKVGRKLKAIGFTSEQKNVELAKDPQERVIGDSNTEKVTQRLVQVPSRRVWEEAVSRYLTGTRSEEVEVPDVLKGSTFRD